MVSVLSRLPSCIMLHVFKIPDLSHRQSKRADGVTIAFVVLLRMLSFLAGIFLLYRAIGNVEVLAYIFPINMALVEVLNHPLMFTYINLVGSVSMIMLCNRTWNLYDVLEISTGKQPRIGRFIMSAVMIVAYIASFGIPGIFLAILPSTNKYYSIRASISR